MSNYDNIPTENTWISYIQDAEDGSGDGILTFPPELIEKMGWKEGTTLHLEVTEEGTLIITDKSLTNNENSV
jgi:antitoxin component of MazEF toxin-antitoxin module